MEMEVLSIDWTEIWFIGICVVIITDGLLWGAEKTTFY